MNLKFNSNVHIIHQCVRSSYIHYRIFKNITNFVIIFQLNKKIKNYLKNKENAWRDINWIFFLEHMRKCANLLVLIADKSNFVDLYAENATNCIVFFVAHQNVLKNVALSDINSTIVNGIKLVISAIYVV
jgi:hypothetical protein